MEIKKIATIVMYTQELLEDAQDDPTLLIYADVRAGFADLIDKHALEWSSAGAVTGSFNSELAETFQSTEYAQADADGLPDAISAAMTTIAANGYNATGAILANDAWAVFRNARDADGRPLFAGGGTVAAEPSNTFWGVPVRYSTNLQTVAGTAAGRVIGVVGDFSHALLAIRPDLTVDVSDQATIDVGGTQLRLWQQNKVAARWEMRGGFVADDLNRAFVTILNAA